MDDYPLLVDVKFANFLRYKTARYQTSPKVRLRLLAETRAFPNPPQLTPIPELEEYEIWQEIAEIKKEREAA